MNQLAIAVAAPYKPTPPPSRRQPRLPVAPLYRLTHAASIEDLALQISASVPDIALESIKRSLVKANTDGGITERRADRYACALGYHPALVWGQDWWTITDKETHP